MLAHQKKDIEEAERRLAQLKKDIRDADEELTGIQSDITDGQKELKRQDEQQIIALKQFDTDMSLKQDVLDDVIKEAQATLDTVQKQRDDVDAERQAQQDKLEDLQAKYRQEFNGHHDVVDAWQRDLNQLQGSIESKQAELSDVTHKVEEVTKKQVVLEEKFVAGENAFGKRSGELQEWVKDWQQKLQKIKNEFQAYEVSMGKIRKEDAERKKDLDNQLHALAAQKRALNNERLDLNEEKKQFYQTKEL